MEDVFQYILLKYPNIQLRLYKEIIQNNSTLLESYVNYYNDFKFIETSIKNNDKIQNKEFFIKVIENIFITKIEKDFFYYLYKKEYDSNQNNFQNYLKNNNYFHISEEFDLENTNNN